MNFCVCKYCKGKGFLRINDSERCSDSDGRCPDCDGNGGWYISEEDTDDISEN